VADRTQAEIDRLDPDTGYKAAVLINALREEGIPAGIVANGGRRDPATQKQLVGEGRSRTLRSYHLLGRAFDLDVLGMSRDSVPEWFWYSVGPWAEKNLGLRWGGRFSSIRDLAHFEDP